MTKAKLLNMWIRVRWIFAAMVAMIIAALTWIYGKDSANPALLSSRRRRLSAERDLARAKARAEADAVGAADSRAKAEAAAVRAVQHTARAITLEAELDVITDDLLAPKEDQDRAARFNARRHPALSTSSH